MCIQERGTVKTRDYYTNVHNWLLTLYNPIHTYVILFAWTVSVCLWIIFFAHRAKNNGMFSWLHWQQGVHTYIHTYIIIVHQDTTVQLTVKFNHTHCTADNNCYQPQSVHQSVSLWCCWSLPVTSLVFALSSICNSSLTANSCILTASQQEPIQWLQGATSGSQIPLDFAFLKLTTAISLIFYRVFKCQFCELSKTTRPSRQIPIYCEKHRKIRSLDSDLKYIKYVLEKRTYTDDNCVICTVKEWVCTYKDKYTEQRHILQLCHIHYREFKGLCPTHQSILSSNSAPTTVHE